MSRLMPKMVFVNISWMDKYKGMEKQFKPSGGKYVAEHGYGGEIYNFLPYKGYCYGSGVRPHKLSRIGKVNNDDILTNVLVIWVAKKPDVGTVIVGWYKDATLYKTSQEPPIGSNRIYKDVSIKYWCKALQKNCDYISKDQKPPTGSTTTCKDVLIRYWCKAKQENCVCIPKDQRTGKNEFIIPRGEGWMGKSNIWYADDKTHAKFKLKVLDFIARYNQQHRASGSAEY